MVVTFDGSSSSDIENDPLTYEWDFDYDGITFDVDEVGASVAFNATDGLATHNIALRVTDSSGDDDVARDDGYGQQRVAGYHDQWRPVGCRRKYLHTHVGCRD